MTSEHVSYTGQELLQRLESDRFGEVHIKLDPSTGLRAIIAIHSTRLGQALGGARCIPYASFDAAFKDAGRLAKGMSYKAAAVGIPHGGGKAVLMRPVNDFRSSARLPHEA
jgi:leucine dehydrogenase